MAKKITHIPATKKLTVGSSDSKDKIRVAAYCRVSSEHDEQLNSFENQVTYYTGFINASPVYELAGIYADEGISGTSTKKRSDFNRMIRDCEKGLIDLIIVKSISRFARNTQDCLHYSRKLKELGIGIQFEREGINTMDSTGELLFTILSSLAQDESRSISENCQWGIRSLMQRGKKKIGTGRFYGYDSDEDGKMIVNKEQARVVRWIYESFLSGVNPDAIARTLNENGVEQCMGGNNWKVTQIKQILENEKYNGDILYQKTYIPDYLTHKSVENTGQLPKYHIKDDHEAIIDKKMWKAVQLELKRRENYMHEHHMTTLGQRTDQVIFTHKVICGCCNHNYVRRQHTSTRGKKHLWQCSQRYPEKGVIGCNAPFIEDDKVTRAFLVAWNELIKNREQFLKKWNKQMESGNELEQLRVRQFIEMTASAEPNMMESKFVNRTLSHILHRRDGNLDVNFLDGTKMTVDVGKMVVQK